MLFCFTKISLLMILVNLKRFCQKGSDLVFTSFFKRYKKLFVFLSTCLILVSYFCLDCFAQIGFIDSTDSSELVTPFNCVVTYDVYDSDVFSDLNHPENYFNSQVYFNLPNVFYSSEFNEYPYFNDTSNIVGSAFLAKLYINDIVGHPAGYFISPRYDFNAVFSIDPSDESPVFVPRSPKIDFYNCLMSNSSGDFIADGHDGTVAYLDISTHGFIQGDFLFGSTEYQSRYPVHYILPQGFTESSEIYLNYYYVLINSNIPWESYEDVISEYMDFDDFIDGVTELRDNFDSSSGRPYGSSGFGRCQALFSWCPAILGNFSFVPITTNYDFPFYDEASDYGDFCDFSVKFYVLDKDAYSSYYEFLIEDAVYGGKSGFERVSWFLGTAVSGFLNLEIMPNFSFAGLLIVLVSFSVVLWWLKVFAGG